LNFPNRDGVLAFSTLFSKADLGLSDTQVGPLNDHVFGPEGIRYSMALLPALFGVPVLAMSGLIRRRYLQAYRQQEVLG
jgi:hypothetical protein